MYNIVLKNKSSLVDMYQNKAQIKYCHTEKQIACNKLSIYVAL